MLAKKLAIMEGGTGDSSFGVRRFPVDVELEVLIGTHNN